MPTGIPPETPKQRADRINAQIAADHEAYYTGRDARNELNGAFRWGCIGGLIGIAAICGWGAWFMVKGLIQ